MLTVETSNKLLDRMTTQATQVVVYNEQDEPVAFVVQLDDSKALAACCGDPTFDELCKMFYIGKKTND